MRLETHSEVRIVLMEFLLFEIWNKTNIKDKYYGIFMRLKTHSVVHIVLNFGVSFQSHKNNIIFFFNIYLF
jgi:hypothetical protein